jgi:hypothetical protein
VCLRGSSAFEKALEQHPETKVTVFAVWEPILPTDLMPPTTGALGRLSDRQIRQYWDREHRLAKIMAESRAGQPQPDCCQQSGTLWDLIAVYPAGAEWRETLPPATVSNGPVLRVMKSAKIL